MTRRRWIADEVSGNRAALTGNHARHLAQVLRARVGQEFDISTGSEVRRGKVISVRAERVEFELGDTVAHHSQFEISLALSVFKFDRMEWAVEKCTELGVAKIIPLIAGRTEKHLASAAAKRVDRWRRIAEQASEQSRRISPPDIVEPMEVDQAVALERDGSRIVLSETEKKLLLKDALPPEPHSVMLALGPEGGWKEQELQLFRNCGWTSASLGQTILRTETAAIAAVAMVRSLLPW